MSTTIPKGSTVLVTGINGYIGSHIADQLISGGYKVRGSARTVEKADAIKSVLDKKYGAGKVEIVAVPDMAAPGAFNTAVKGVTGIAHVASNLSFSSDPNAVIPEVVAGITSILDSAANESSVKRFVYTSSSTAAIAAIPNKKFTITNQTWNQDDVDKAWGPDYPGRGWAVYGASKTEAERFLWKFVTEKSPHFVANAVLPNANFGPRFVSDGGSTSNWPIAALKGLGPQWFVDVRDTAALHVAALIEEDVQNERLWAYSEPYTIRSIFDAVQKARPNAKLAEFTFTDDKDLMLIPGTIRAVELLKRQGRNGFIGMEESIAANIEGL